VFCPSTPPANGTGFEAKADWEEESAKKGMKKISVSPSALQERGLGWECPGQGGSGEKNVKKVQRGSNVILSGEDSWRQFRKKKETLLDLHKNNKTHNTYAK